MTWGVNPGQSIGDRRARARRRTARAIRQAVTDALDYMGLTPGSRLTGMKVDVAFIGSCTNGRLSDLREAARIVRGRHVAPHVKALVVPGSVGGQQGGRARRARRDRSAPPDSSGAAPAARCASGMNPDKLEGNQVCAASSNRNFKGRQGSPTGRTLLMSPAMVAAAAVAGEVTDVREVVELMAAESLHVITGRGAAAARRRHRHRSHHAGAVSPRDHVRRARAARVRGRPQERARIRTTVIRSTSPQYQGASILLVNRNFGCGSSREHAPQGLQRWGIHAVVGESFAEIFFGNSVMIGMPCVTASPADVAGADGSRRAKPETEVAHRSRWPARARPADFRCAVSLPPNVRDAFVTGAWDTTGLLLDRYEEVDATSQRLPYVDGILSARRGGPARPIFAALPCLLTRPCRFFSSS